MGEILYSYNTSYRGGGALLVEVCLERVVKVVRRAFLQAVDIGVKVDELLQEAHVTSAVAQVLVTSVLVLLFEPPTWY